MHISDEDLERYCLGMVTDEAELSPLEEHLLGCHACIDRAQGTQKQIKVIRDALSTDEVKRGRGARSVFGTFFRRLRGR